MTISVLASCYMIAFPHFLSGRMSLWVLDCWLELAMKTLCLGILRAKQNS